MLTRADNFWDVVLPEEKTPERLLLRLKRTDSLDTEQQQVDFLGDVHNLVKEAITAWEDDVLVNVSSLISLLREVLLLWSVCVSLTRVSVQCVIDLRFNEVQRQHLQQWLQVVEHPRRKRKTVEKFTIAQQRYTPRLLTSCLHTPSPSFFRMRMLYVSMY